MLRFAALSGLVLAVACPGQDPPPVKRPAEPVPAFGGGWPLVIGLGGNAGGPYALRRPGVEGPGVERAALDAGLTWLANAQEDDGSWPATAEGSDGRVAVTSLATLALLGSGSTMRSGPHRRAIKRGIRWLRDQQAESGAFAQATGPHMLATLAMVEAYTVSSYRLLRANCERALGHLGELRDEDGGWRGRSDANDSVPELTAWGATVLAMARFGKLLETFDAPRFKEWLDGPRANLAASTLFGLQVFAAQRSALAFDQELANAWTRCWLGSTDASSSVKVAHERGWNWQMVGERRPSLTAWLHAADVTVQQGQAKALAKLCGSLAKGQAADGKHAGSWEPIDVFGQVCGRAGTTSLALLVLEAPFRYAPGVAGLLAPGEVERGRDRER